MMIDVAGLRAMVAKAAQEDDDVRYYGGATGTYRPHRVVNMVDLMDLHPSRGGGVLPTDKAAILHAARTELASLPARTQGTDR